MILNGVTWHSAGQASPDGQPLPPVHPEGGYQLVAAGGNQARWQTGRPWCLLTLPLPQGAA